MDAPATSVDSSIPSYQPPAQGARPSAFLDTVQARGDNASPWGSPPPRDPGQAPTITEGRGNAQHAKELAQDFDQQNQAKLPGDEPLEGENTEVVDPESEEGIELQRQSALNEIRTALDEGRFPMEQLADFPVQVKVDGETFEVPLKEAINGFQRQQKMTRVIERAQMIEAKSNHILQLEQRRTQEWQQSPDALMDGLMGMGCGQAFEAAARKWAAQRVEYLQKSPQERALIDQRRVFEAEQKAWKETIRQQQMQQQQNRGPDPATVHAQKQIEQLMPRALRAVGIQNQLPEYQAAFIRNLQILCTEAGSGVTPDLAMQAAVSTKEFYVQQARLAREQGYTPTPHESALAMQQTQAPTQGNPRAYPLGPRRAASGPYGQQPLMLGMPLGNGQQGGGQRAQKGRRPSDFAKMTGLG